MEWQTFGSYDVYVHTTTGRINGRAYKNEKGFTAMVTPPEPVEKEKAFLGYYLTLEAAKAAVEAHYHA